MSCSTEFYMLALWLKLVHQRTIQKLTDFGIWCSRHDRAKISAHHWFLFHKNAVIFHKVHKDEKLFLFNTILAPTHKTGQDQLKT